MHSPTLIDHEDVLDQEFVKPGQTLSLVVPAALAPGDYPLGGNIHFDMKAKIVVQGGTPPRARHLRRGRQAGWPETERDAARDQVLTGRGDGSMRVVFSN